jgi:hypothetical protein
MVVNGELHAPIALNPRKELLVPVAWEAVWASEPIWMLWSREKSLSPTVNWTPAVQPVPVAILTGPFWLLCLGGPAASYQLGTNVATPEVILYLSEDRGEFFRKATCSNCEVPKKLICIILRSLDILVQLTNHIHMQIIRKSYLFNLAYGPQNTCSSSICSYFTLNLWLLQT